MSRVIFSFSFLLFLVSGSAQTLTHAQFSGGSKLSSFAFTTDQQVIIKISEDGKVTGWGTEWETWRYNYQPGKLLPYMGRVTYYGTEGDSASKGKIKSVGTTVFTYYPYSEEIAKAGKLRFVGSLMLDYYSHYDNAAFEGKLKSAGNNQFTYYPSYENEAFRGQLKSVNNSTITYYSSFDDKSIKGKVKSIGNTNFTWYASYDTHYSGMKSGQIINWINGIRYILF